MLFGEISQHPMLPRMKSISELSLSLSVSMEYLNEDDFHTGTDSNHDSSSGIASDIADVSSYYQHTDMSTFKTKRKPPEKDHLKVNSRPPQSPKMAHPYLTHEDPKMTHPYLTHDDRVRNGSPGVMNGSTIIYKNQVYNPHQINSEINHIQTQLKIMDFQDTSNYLSGSDKKFYRTSPFDLLTDVIIVRIFSHLTTDRLCSCSRVCQRWYHLAWDPTLWTSIVINSETIYVDKAIKQLTKHLSFNTPTVCITVEKIMLIDCERLTDKGLHMIAKRFPELRHLEIPGCANITNQTLFEVISYCVNLEHLNVAGCPFITSISLVESMLIRVFTHHLHQIYLRYLDLTDCCALQDDGLESVAVHCSQLQYLYLRRCMRITDVGIEYIATNCSEIREFSISDCRKVTDFGLRELSRLGPSLRYLSVAKCDKVSDVGIKYIAKHCNKLRYLNVRGCEAVSDESLRHLGEYCSRLRSLDLGKCDITDAGLKFLAEKCTQLRKLSLKSCETITDQGLIAVARSCRLLQQLNIQDCRITVNAYRTVKRYCKWCLIEHTNPGFC